MARSLACASRVARRTPRPSRRRHAAVAGAGRPGDRGRRAVPPGRGEPPRERDPLVSGGPEALERYLLSLRARDASEHTIRSYATAVGAYLDWLEAHGADWRAPARADLRAYLARLVTSVTRSTVSQRLAAIRSFHRFAARAELAPGDPWSAIATPRIPKRLPRVLEVEQIERLLDAIDDPAIAAADTAPRRRRRRPSSLAGAIAL